MLRESELFWLTCRVRHSEEESEKVRALADSLESSSDLKRLCVAAGVLPVTYQTLARLLAPEHPLLPGLRESFLGHSLRAFQSAPELVCLSQALEEAGIRSLALKGMAVSQQMFGNLVSRPVGDLDLLVPERQAWRAVGVFHGRGYQQAYPARLSDDQERSLIFYGEGRQFSNSRTEVDADLNWKTLDRWVDVRLPFDELWERREVLSFPTGALPTLGREDSALLLCLHGCQHGFERIKWVLDVAQAARPDSRVAWGEVRKRAGHRRPMVDYALLVAQELTGSSLPLQCDPSPAVRALAGKTVRSLLDGLNPSQREGLLDRAIATNLEPCLSTRGRWGLLSNLATFACPSKEDVESVRLPYALRHLYYGLRIFHLVKKLAQRSAV